MIRIETERLLLREWQDHDLEPFVLINQDSKVLEFLRAPLSSKETADWIERIKLQFAEHGFGLWAVTLKSTKEFIGFVGLDIPSFESHFTPCVEIGWRLASEHWRKGYATEAARAVLKVAFEKFKLKRVVSFTVPNNKASIHIMEKLGMKHDIHGDFYHPKLPLDHPLSLHVLYRITNEQYYL